MTIFQTLDDAALIAMLRQGKVGVIPSDTVYGVVARADLPDAVSRLYDLKQREHKPGTTIAANVEQLVTLGIEQRYLKRAAHIWPNPISVILPLPDTLSYIHQGLGSAPFRVVADPAVCRLLEQTGPLSTSSANHPGQPPATNLAEAQAYFGNSVDFYVDGGDLGERPPSTIVKVGEAGDMQIIRQGAVHIKDDVENNSL
jgi:L-threonylcarbamoyladenylate synthase